MRCHNKSLAPTGPYIPAQGVALGERRRHFGALKGRLNLLVAYAILTLVSACDDKAEPRVGTDVSVVDVEGDAATGTDPDTAIPTDEATDPIPDAEIDTPDDPDISEPRPTFRITSVEVEEYSTYRLLNDEIPDQTGDLWPCAWGADDRLYTANGDGMGFGSVWSDIVFSIVDGYPRELVGSSPDDAFGPYIATVWGPNPQEVSRKPTGLVCIDGDIYMFFQNLKNFMSDNVFGDAPHASISVTRDSGVSWEFDSSEPMFTDHVFTTGFFLDYGRCQEHAPDDWVYVYGLDYNWRFSDGFLQTKMYLARVPDDRIMDRSAWEFLSGFDQGAPSWSLEIDDKTPVLEDDTIYCDDLSAIAQGSVVYIPPLNRYLYSSRSKCVWIFYEAPRPWGPWTKTSVVEWSNGWREDYHPGYNAVIPSKFVDEDGLGGWVISSLPDSWFDGTYYSMSFRRFELEVEEVIEE